MDFRTQYQKALIADALEMLNSVETDCIAHLRDGLRRYLADRIETGGFLRCVLENDLDGAINRAHPSLRMEQMKALVELIGGTFPAQSWGSVEAVKAWLGENGDGASELVKS